MGREARMSLQALAVVLERGQLAAAEGALEMSGHERVPCSLLRWLHGGLVMAQKGRVVRDGEPSQG